jgi:uncharacterized protein YcbX
MLRSVVTVRKILIHPIKALDAVPVAAARLLGAGALELDRRWAFVDRRERFVNGKNRPEVHQIRAKYDLSRLEVALDGRVYSLEHQRAEIVRWMSERLGEPVELRENLEAGFPDDTLASGPTFVSEASLSKVAEWFEFSPEGVQARFRTNVELGGVAAFWEDRLYGSEFRVGDVRVHATNACKRCVVPARDPLTGEPLVGFQKRFTQLREANLPPEAAPEFFDHSYRFAVNTRIAPGEAGKFIREGDAITYPI